MGSLNLQDQVSPICIQSGRTPAQYLFDYGFLNAWLKLVDIFVRRTSISVVPLDTKLLKKNHYFADLLAIANNILPA